MTVFACHSTLANWNREIFLRVCVLISMICVSYAYSPSSVSNSVEMFVVYITFFPLVGLLFALYYRRKSSSSWLMDLNTTAALRSLIFGANKSFFQSEDVTCFHGATMASPEPHKKPSSHQSSVTESSLSKSASKLKSTLVEYLPPENFSFHKCPELSDSSQQKLLLILFAWLFAKERHLDKYRKLYMDKGFDVLTVKVNVPDFLIPQSGSQQIAANIVRFLEERKQNYRAYIFHAFSVGVYQMGELFVLLNKQSHKEAYKNTQNLLKGIIYDSALDVDEAAIGLSKATTSNAILQWAISTLMNAHLRICYHISTRHYILSSQAIHENKFGCPTLVFLSKDDEVANYVHQFEIVDKWRQKGIKVVTKCWEQSPHVSHFFKHPDEYRQLMDDFLTNIAKIL